MPLRSIAALAALATLALAAPPAGAKQPYTATPGPERADATFTATYAGSGAWRTTFHGEPPNPDGHDDDVNDARDSSRQRWALRFSDPLAIPTCGDAQGDDPCAAVSGLTGASGPASMTGRVNHRHKDGIYRELDRVVKCGLAKRTGRKRLHDVALNVRYLPEAQSFAVSATSPMTTTLSMFPTQCPKQGDPIDRILDFYATPGFSFADGWGPERWFASKTVVIPADVFHRSETIAIPLRDTRAGTPPRRCAVRDPSFERCKTGGSWRGVLKLTARGASQAKPFASVRPKVVAPRGHYRGNTGGSRRIQLDVARRRIDLVAFDFKCRRTTGRTSLNGLQLKKTARGWRLPSTLIFGSATYADERPDENVRVVIRGRFSTTGKSIRGTLRVRSPQCGDTGTFAWSARKR